MSKGPIHIDVRPAVRVDADDLERLVRHYHEWLPDSTAVQAANEFLDGDLVELAPWLGGCACGHRVDRRDHGSHVDYHVRQALAGRIEWP